MAKTKFKTKPFNHQLEALKLSEDKPAFAFFMQQGTGKTWVVINEMAQLWSQGKINAVEVYAPKGVHDNWLTDELPKHMPDWVDWEACCWNADALVKERRAIDKFLSSPTSGHLRIFLVNWDAVVTPRGLEAIRRFRLSVNKLMMVADESQYIKTYGARRTKAAVRLSKAAKYRRLMTGTPVANAPFDLFSQFQFLDPTILRTTSYYAFKAQYADMLNDQHKLVQDIKRRTNKTPQIVAKDRCGNPMYKNLDKLAAMIAPYVYRKLKRDCLDLPDKLYTPRYFTLTPAQRAAYNLMRDECRAILADGTIKAMQKLAAIMKLAQLTSGYIIISDNEAQRIDGENPKLKLLEEELQRNMESDEGTIVWCRFHVEIEDVVAVCKRNDWPFVEYHGKIKKKQRLENRQAFQAKDAKIFIGQQQAGGTGLTLTEASSVIYYSNTFSLLDREQSEDRAHRIGQSKHVNYIDLIAKNTIDGAIVKALQRKQKLASLINQDDLL